MKFHKKGTCGKFGHQPQSSLQTTAYGFAKNNVQNRNREVHRLVYFIYGFTIPLKSFSLFFLRKMLALLQKREVVL